MLRQACQNTLSEPAIALQHQHEGSHGLWTFHQRSMELLIGPDIAAFERDCKRTRLFGAQAYTFARDCIDGTGSVAD